LIQKSFLWSAAFGGLQDECQSGVEPTSRREKYEWASGRWYWLTKVDGKPVESSLLLDMDSDEFDRQMQAEFERQGAGRRCGGSLR